MAWKDSKVHRWNRPLSAFKYAFQGMGHVVKYEKNFQIHLVVAALVILSGLIFKLNQLEWLFIVIAIFGVLALELVNSAIERVVDLTTSEIKPLAKQAKDIAAAAVLVYAIMSVIIGIFIFGPKLLTLMK